MGRSRYFAVQFFALAASSLAYAQSSGAGTTSLSVIGDTSSDYPSTTQGAATVTVSGTVTSFRPIFTVPAAADVGAVLLPNIQDPQAVDPQSICPGYTASDIVTTPSGFNATLTLAGAACNLYGTDIDTLTLSVEYQSSNRLHVEIVPTYIDASNTSQYILPNHLVYKPTVDTNGSLILMSDLTLTWSNNHTFGFTITRNSTGDVLFDTQGTKLVFENQFIEFGSPLPKNYNLYGLGETIHGLRLGNNFTKTIYAADSADPIDFNIYGSHPFYLDTRYYEIDSTSGNLTLVTNDQTNATGDYISYSHGVYLRNSHGQEILLRPQNITWRTLGGSIDLYFYAGPTQPDVTTAWETSAIGLPAMQQYFTFGYHQCRWGYKNWTELQEVVDNFEYFGIPLENIWTDIDYMNQYRDFENDQNTFPYPQGQQFLSQLHAGGRHYIPIVDSAIYIPNPMNASDAYPIFDRGNTTGAFMNNPDGSLYIGEVWPGYTVFPDWISGGAGQWWINELTTWHGDVPFDGIWIDMSEVSSFCIGSCGTDNVTMNPVHPGFSLPGEPGAVIYSYPENFNVTNATEAASASSASSIQAAAASSSAGPAPSSTTTPDYLRTIPTPGMRDVNHPPYVINNVQGDLAVHAMSPNATHADGTQDYDVHNLFGHQILNATYNALLNIFPSKRPFIIGRSTFSGSGIFAGHWGGDNFSQFLYMAFSIPQALSFSLFGIPMFGVDTCGFNNNSDEELCNRWMQLSAFFPFYRNHNVLSANSQEPYVWASVIDATKTAMDIRYQLLPYIYTLFYNAHTTGSTVMRALAWEFPNDPSLAAVDRQFMLGPSILITPVLTQGAVTVDGVFPGVGTGEVWYDWYTQAAVSATAGVNTTIDAPLGHIPVFVRGGYVLPTQQPALVTRDARDNPWGLIAALSATGLAEGSLYVDDGESLVPNATLQVSFTAASSTLQVSVQGSYKDTNALANVTLLGVASPVSTVTLNGANIPSSAINYNTTSKCLAITSLNNATSAGAWSANWTLAWS
ncbi:MAG: hypothetical protein M1827_001220 [Pycnora praestabilis]|nr:MAG: hypothetical protein M1827_001220 [Pycnora praestabilis]